MDPVSQGALGAAWSVAAAKPQKLAAFAGLGCAAGMAPDLDVFIQSATDPLLFLEFHRHFTHALIFIPVGALIVAGALYGLVRKRLNWRETYLACLIGYATHGLLDACTSYGTQLFWPFSDLRVAWNNVSVVDPLFTLPLVALVIAGVRSANPRWARAGIAWALAYLLLGAVQLYRAENTALLLAEQRGHTPLRLTMKPSFGNLVLWKSIYEHHGVYYVDAVRVLTDARVCPGEAVPKLSVAEHLPMLRPGSQQDLDLARFRWFSDDYLAPTGDPGAVTDIRYSMVPNQARAMWGITLRETEDAKAFVTWWSRREVNAEQRARFWALLTGRDCTATTH